MIPKHLYIPTCSQNFNNIMSSESISPAGFYERRNFGMKRFLLLMQSGVQALSSFASLQVYFVIQSRVPLLTTTVRYTSISFWERKAVNQMTRRHNVLFTMHCLNGGSFGHMPFIITMPTIARVRKSAHQSFRLSMQPCARNILMQRICRNSCAMSSARVRCR